MTWEFDMELLRKTITGYLKSAKKGKTKILSEYCVLTGARREAALKRFSRYKFDKGYGSVNKKRTGNKKKSKYDLGCRNLVRKLWDLGGLICAERLHTVIGTYLEQMELNEELETYSKEAVEKVLKISLASLKRIINGFPRVSSKKHRGNCDLYKNVRIVADFGKYAKKKPGYVEVDYVEHNGGCSSGLFAITGNYADLYSQWVTRAASLGKGLASVEEIDKKAESKRYFPVIHYHPDNDKSILSLLLKKLQSGNNGIYDLSRSRPYQKNDNAHVEQKNGDKIRKLVGYHRYGTEREVELLNRIYDKADTIDNFFVPSVKLKEKVYDARGKVVKKIYDKPLTPYQRILNSKDVSGKIKWELRLIYNSLNLVKSRKELNALLEELMAEIGQKAKKFSQTKVMSQQGS